MFTLVPSTELDYFGNWSREFHVRFDKYKKLVLEDESKAIETIINKLELSKSAYRSFTIAGEERHITAFGTTVINKAVDIIQGKKVFDTFEPALLVALLYLLDLVIDKKLLTARVEELQEEITKLSELLEKI